MLLIGFVIAAFFILMICFICRGYLEDIIELENRVLQLEKRISYQERYCDDGISDFLDFKKQTKETLDFIIDCETQQDILIKNLHKEITGKDGDVKMACKKGKGGKRK